VAALRSVVRGFLLSDERLDPEQQRRHRAAAVSAQVPFDLAALAVALDDASSGGGPKRYPAAAQKHRIQITSGR
jgi:hypothetical protein